MVQMAHPKRRLRRQPRNASDAYALAERLYRNAKETLKKSPIRYGIYEDPKYVREACGVAYLAPLLALDGYLMSVGYEPDELPETSDEYFDVIPKRIPKNGRLRAALTVARQNLHVLGYYRGGVDVEMIKSGFEKARAVMDMVAPR